MWQRLQEMRAEEAQRTKGTRDRKERKRLDREATRLAAQCALLCSQSHCGSVVAA